MREQYSNEEILAMFDEPTICSAKEDLTNTLRSLETEDFQNRRGNYPREGIPDTITFRDDGDRYRLTAAFKNTSVGVAKSWLSSYLSGEGLKPNEVTANQAEYSGYLDDWVEAHAIFFKEQEGFKGEVQKKLLAIGYPSLSVRSMNVTESDRKVDVYFYAPAYKYDDEDIRPVLSSWLAKAGFVASKIFVSRWGDSDTIWIKDIRKKD